MIGWLIRWCARTAPDTAWKPTGLKPMRPEWESYDQDKAVNGRLKALERAKAARKLADAYNRTAATRKSDVVRIETRRRR